MSTGKKSNPGEFREKVESVQVPENCADEYRKMVESGSVPKNYRIRTSLGKGRIRASTKKMSGRVPKYGRISVSTEKSYNPGEYW